MARAAWPDLAVDESSFVAHIGRCVPPTADPATTLPDLHVADLYLARACLDAIPGATAAFERRYRPVVAKYLARINGGSGVTDDVSQILFARMLLSSEGHPSGLAQYQGRSTLAHFIGIAAQRLALNHRRADQNRRQLVDRLADEPVSPARGPEHSLLRQRYRKPFEAALRAAVAQLTGRERVVMRLHLVGRVSTGRIARMYQVNQATVSRWLSRARAAIWAEVQRRLHQDLGLPPSDLESLMHSVASGIDLSLSAALATTKAPPARR